MTSVDGWLVVLGVMAGMALLWLSVVATLLLLRPDAVGVREALRLVRTFCGCLRGWHRIRRSLGGFGLGCCSVPRRIMR